MALTLRTNGTGGGIVSSAWWNDYYNLLTGVMTDQPVTITNTLSATVLKGLLGTATANAGVSFKDNAGNIEFDANAPGGASRGILFAGVDSSGTLHAGFQVNGDGSAQVGALNTQTSAVQLIKVYTGTTTPPTSGPDGSIWFKG